MTTVTVFGHTVDPGELRVLAATWDADSEEGFRDRLAKFCPRAALTRETLAKSPEYIRDRLLAVADFAERWDRGEAFKGTLEAFAQAAAEREDRDKARRGREAHIRQTIAALGVRAWWDALYEHIVLPLESAEQLAARLGKADQ